MMHAAGVPYYPGITDKVDLPQAVRDKFDPIGLGRELGQVAADRGYIYEQTYSTDNYADGFNAQGKLGVELGVSADNIELSRQTSEYRYWDGTAMVDRAECVV